MLRNTPSLEITNSYAPRLTSHFTLTDEQPALTKTTTHTAKIDRVFILHSLIVLSEELMEWSKRQGEESRMLFVCLVKANIVPQLTFQRHPYSCYSKSLTNFYLAILPRVVCKRGCSEVHLATIMISQTFEHMLNAAISISPYVVVKSAPGPDRGPTKAMWMELLSFESVVVQLISSETGKRQLRKMSFLNEVVFIPVEPP